MSILCLYIFDTQAQIQGPFLYTLLLNYIPPPPPLPHSFAYFLISGYLFLTPDILEVDCIAVAWTRESIKWPQHYIHVPCWVIYQKFILKKFGISFENQFGYMYCNRGKEVELSQTLYCKHSNQNTPPSTPQILSHTKLSHFLEESAINYVDTL